MRLPGILAAVAVCAACSGAARPVAERAVPAPPHGERDAAGRPHGDWSFDCDGDAMTCRGWFEHGTQVQWAKLVPGTADRYVVDAIDGGWRWQYWSGDILRGEGGLAVAPVAWTPGEPVEFAYVTPPQQGACSGPFFARGLDGTFTESGTCAGARWVEQIAYDDRGRPVSINRRSRNILEYDYQTLDSTGVVLTRSRFEGSVETEEAWYPDGRRRYRRMRDGITSDHRAWYADGQLAEEDVTAENHERTLRRFARDGTLIAEASWFGGLPSGTWRTWYDTGKRRSTVRFADTGEPSGALVVWTPGGALAGEADLATLRWIRRGGRGTRVVKARPPRGTDRTEIDGFPSCQATDALCLRRLATALFDLTCLQPSPDDPLTVWSGRVELTLGVDRTGAAGVIAIGDAGGLARAYQDCLTATASQLGVAHELELVVDVDLLQIGDPLR
jgi:hypothetical protein